MALGSRSGSSRYEMPSESFHVLFRVSQYPKQHMKGAEDAGWRQAGGGGDGGDEWPPAPRTPARLKFAPQVRGRIGAGKLARRRRACQATPPRLAPYGSFRG